MTISIQSACSEAITAGNEVEVTMIDLYNIFRVLGLLQDNISDLSDSNHHCFVPGIYSREELYWKHNLGNSPMRSLVPNISQNLTLEQNAIRCVTTF
jgi:hypothetical protein